VPELPPVWDIWLVYGIVWISDVISFKSLSGRLVVFLLNARK
jgi:hypothetical protein